MKAQPIKTELVAADIVANYYKCPFCGTITAVELPIHKWIELKDNLVQDVLPDASPYTREAIITGMCKKCIDSFFEEEP